MTSLNDYLQPVQRMLREARQELINPGDLIAYINDARVETAMRAQCIRRLTPSSGSCMQILVTAGGTGYSSTPTVTISAPDFPNGQLPDPNGRQATAQAIVQAGVITAIYVQDGGDGYFQPTVTITDTTGTGATAEVSELSFINMLNPGQEQYAFSDIDVSMFPGVESVYAVHSVSVLYANQRYSLPMYSFSTYQAQIRQFPYQYQWVPGFSSQFGQGVDGTLFVYPLPSQYYQWEMDCFCLPSPLTDNQSVEALPSPWTKAVPFYAVHLAMLEMQNFNGSKFYFELYDKMILRQSSYARPGRATNIYGRY